VKRNGSRTKTQFAALGCVLGAANQRSQTSPDTAAIPLEIANAFLNYLWRGQGNESPILSQLTEFEFFLYRIWDPAFCFQI